MRWLNLECRLIVNRVVPLTDTVQAIMECAPKHADRDPDAEGYLKVLRLPQGGTEELPSHLMGVVRTTCANAVLMPVHLRCAP
jgi:hypothetical protein